MEVRKWVLSRLLRGLAAVVGTVLAGKLARLLLAEGREAIGSRFRINCIHLPAVLNRTSFKLGEIERSPPEAREEARATAWTDGLLSRWEEEWLNEESPILAIQTLIKAGVTRSMELSLGKLCFLLGREAFM